MQYGNSAPAEIYFRKFCQPRQWHKSPVFTEQYMKRGRKGLTGRVGKTLDSQYDLIEMVLDHKWSLPK